ncbi:MAG: hypothetical protein ACJZ6C_06615 [Candidatus Poriferisodalaceae bacterium]
MTAVDDTDVDGNQNVTLTTAVNDAASDAAYDPLANQTVGFVVADNDAVPGPEIIDPDYDRDGIYNWNEKSGCALLPDCDFDGLLDPDELAQCITNPDCDADGIGDGGEIWACLLTPDCDGDGVEDADEANVACIQDPKCTTGADADGDGIYDRDELPRCVDNPDCDGDGISDFDEIFACILLSDCDNDGLGDRLEKNRSCIQDPTCGPRAPSWSRIGRTS